MAVALREVGRLERTLSTLNRILSSDLGRRAQIGLNKDEARSALARTVFLNRLDELGSTIRGPGLQGVGLNLVVAAIILWNTRYLDKAFSSLGTGVPQELRTHVATLGWEHVNLTGYYIWIRDAEPERGRLRPLGRPQSLLAA